MKRPLNLMFNNNKRDNSVSTRCNIVIENKNDALYLYHHCDGYPEGVGNELLELSNMLKSGMMPSDVYDTLVYLYGDYYEITNKLHGDIEYVYNIKLNEDNAEIIFNKCVRNDPFGRYDKYSVEPIAKYTFNYIDYDTCKNDSYTKGDLLNKKVRFTCDFTVDMKDSCVYGEMQDEMIIDSRKLFKLLLRAYAGEIVDNTKIEILQ